MARKYGVIGAAAVGSGKTVLGSIITLSSSILDIIGTWDCRSAFEYPSAPPVNLLSKHSRVVGSVSPGRLPPPTADRPSESEHLLPSNLFHDSARVLISFGDIDIMDQTGILVSASF